MPVTCPYNKAGQQSPGLPCRASPAFQGNDPAPLLSAGETQLECCIQGSQYRRDVDIEERVQWMATKVIKGLEHPSYEERLRDLGVFGLKKWRFKGDFINLNKYMKGGARRTEPGSLQWCGDRTGGKRAQSYPERLGSLHPWRYSSTDWRCFWAIWSGWPCFEQRGWARQHPKFPSNINHSLTLWPA